MKANSQSTAIDPASAQLGSLDALRGFDMFWIIGAVGGAAIVEKFWAQIQASQLEATWYGRTVGTVAEQLTHVPWNGFRAYDLIFPLFLFIAGAAMPFSLGRRMEKGEARGKLALKVVRRGLLLVLLGLIFNGLLSVGFTHELRWGSVLGRIGLAYMFAGLIYLATGVRGQIAGIIVLLVGYWAAMMYVPVPGIGTGVLEDGKTLADYFDQRLMPGTLYLHDRVLDGVAIPDHDPEGLLSTIPAIASVLLGALAGTWLRRSDRSDTSKSAGLFAAGLVALALGWAWAGFQINPPEASSLSSPAASEWRIVFPINKNLWSSSFVLWTTGWSLLLLAIFYQVVDVWRLEKWAFFFTVIGTNSITIYMAKRFIDFDKIGAFLITPGPKTIHPMLTPLVGLALAWGCLYVMHRNRWFLRL